MGTIMGDRQALAGINPETRIRPGARRRRRRLRVVARWTLAPGAAVLLLVAWPVAGLGLVAVAWLLRSDPEPNARK
jgi:hypothetical protein